MRSDFMTNDRYRHERERYRGRDRGWQDRDEDRFGRDRYRSDHGAGDDGYIARRGFGNESAGYGRGRGYDEERERDFGDSAGYGTGGSARDWRDVMGEDRGRWGGSPSAVDVFGRDRERGSPGYGSSYGRESGRYDTGHFGRGSRDYNEDRGFFERAGDEVRSWFGDEDADRRRDMDVRRAESHRGRGPKGYQRSDERIREDINDRLTDDPHIDASDIEATVSDREVTLNGTVSSRFEKRHAEDLAESVSGVSHVQNNLRVQRQADAGMGGSMLSGRDTGSTSGAGGMGDPGAARRRSASSSST
jgi:osmotically-inducible protein OsmY